MNGYDARQDRPFFHFGLLVTGRGEEQFLTRLFRPLEATGHCHFKVIRKIEQLSPRGEKKTITMVGCGKLIPDRDMERIGLPARRFLNGSPDSFVVLVDDLEHDRRDIAPQIFQRYRIVFDQILGDMRLRASVHFLVPMMEAYFFAHAQAVNGVLGTGLADATTDVEQMRNPKSELKRLFQGYDEVVHGKQIMNRLAVEHVLSCPETCCSLRTLFVWCVQAMCHDEDRFQLEDGCLSPVTQNQIDSLQPE